MTIAAAAVLILLALSMPFVRRWCMQDHVSLRTNTIVTTAYVTIAAACVLWVILT